MTVTVTTAEGAEVMAADDAYALILAALQQPSRGIVIRLDCTPDDPSK